MKKEKFKINSKIDFYTDIVSTNANDRPLIYISNEAIELKYNNDKLKKENDLLKNRIEKATKCINRYAIENEDYSKIYNNEEKELLNILRGEDKE